MAAIFDKPASGSSPPLRPKFSLGGQVCRYSSNPQIGGLNGESEQAASPDLDHTGSGIMPRSTPARSLNPELLMREFTRDDQGRIDSMGVNDSPSACFQSQFAREVVQNTRRSSSVVMLDNADQKQSLPSSKNSRRSSMTTAAAASVKYRSQFAAKYHQPGQDDDSSDSTCEPEQEMHLQKPGQQQHSSKRTSILLNSALDKMTSLAANEPAEDDNLWMTSTQFSQLLDKQEAMENHCSSSGKPKKQSIGAQSYLDSEALLPFAKLKQTCDDLGFTYSDKEWLQIRKMLQNSGKNNEEMVVRSEDFFAAIHTIMANKQNRQRMASGPEVKHHPNSMKSDSGGEMESCRSSDSELERELHEKEREIQERDRELTNCYRTIAERDTELIKVRLECQRLLEDNRHLRDQLDNLEAHTNPKKQMEMEKEIDSLKWHLSVMENSRKSYESATQQLVSFLEHVTSMLQATSPSQRKLFEATKAQVLKTTGKNYKQRFSLGGSSSSSSGEPMFRAESMPGLNMRGSMLSLSTNGGDNMSLSSSSQSHYYQQHLATMPRRHGSTSSGSSNRTHRNVHRSQSTHSKRSPMPSLQESTSSQADEDQVDYVNTSALAELIAAEPDRPKSVAEISQKENVCNIKITKSEEKKNSVTTKRSASSVSKRSTNLKPNDKASRLLGIDEHQNVTTMLDSGRFSMGSSLSPTNEKKSLSNSESLLKIQDSAKFKSLGDLHMEKGLPTVLVQNGEDGAADEDSKTSLLHACRSMLKRTKKMLARDTKTLEITPLKASKSRSSLPGSGQKQTLQLISQ